MFTQYILHCWGQKCATIDAHIVPLISLLDLVNAQIHAFLKQTVFSNIVCHHIGERNLNPTQLRTYTLRTYTLKLMQHWF